MNHIAAHAAASARASADDLERPVGASSGNGLYGSDIVAEAIQSLGVPYLLLNPGASFRGLHDSLVNYLGNRAPQMLLCLHEEHAVAIAHGWAKVTGEPLAVAVHSNVGLFHATMAIFNAWCDRVPVVVFGATGPVDAAKRRPWIDWLHTAQDQGAIVRSYVKWDAEPASPAAAREAILRAGWLARTAPRGPVYVNLDAGMQEELTEALPPIDTTRYMPDVRSAPAAAALDRAAELLRGAGNPLILMGRLSRRQEDWDRRVALAEALAARVGTELKVGATFPTDHVLHVGSPQALVSAELAAAISVADVILSLDWVDLAGALGTRKDGGAGVKVIQASLDYQLHNGWSMDHQALPGVDVFLPAEPDDVVALLLERLGSLKRPLPQDKIAGRPSAVTPGKLDVPAMTRALREATAGRAVSLLRVSLSWNGADWDFRHPLDYIGHDGGGGIGSGPGMAIGSALALRGSGRLPVAVIGDGDFLMSATALWTATHYRIPLLVIVANNRSFFNDEVHQEKVARQRGRPVENKWIGQRIDDPAVDIAAIATAQGAAGFGPVTEAAGLDQIFRDAIAIVEAGGVAVVDVRVETGYTPAMASLAQDKAQR